jgi:hypothetical protein
MFFQESILNYQENPTTLVYKITPQMLQMYVSSQFVNKEYPKQGIVAQTWL